MFLSFIWLFQGLHLFSMLPRMHTDRVGVSPWRWSRIKTRIHVYSVRHKLTSWDLISRGLSFSCLQAGLVGQNLISLSLSSCLHWLFDYNSISKLKFEMFLLASKFWKVGYWNAFNPLFVIFTLIKNDFIKIAFFCILHVILIKYKKRWSLLILKTYFLKLKACFCQVESIFHV